VQVTKATKEADGTLTLDLNTGSKITDVNCLLWAIGRVPNSDKIGLENAVSFFKLLFNKSFNTVLDMNKCRKRATDVAYQ